MFLNLIPENVSKWALIGIGAVAAIGIYLLNDLHRNVFVNIGAGVWDTYNMATGLMGDILSYMRLYALGLAGGMLGGVFNSLGLMVQDSVGGILWLGSVLSHPGAGPCVQHCDVVHQCFRSSFAFEFRGIFQEFRLRGYWCAL